MKLVTGCFKELFPKGSHNSDSPGDDMKPVVTKLVDHGYEWIRPLGKGGTGSVFEAWSNHLDRRVALKVLSPRLWNFPTSRHRFAREARIASKLRHPNIVRTLDYGVAAGAPYLVMENIGGDSLDRVIKTGGINQRQAMKVIMHVARGLTYAWKYHVIHRDIKLSNIMLTPDGSAKICDFGSCKNVHSGSNLTRTWPVNCTPAYCSPELARREKGLDCRTDVYSLGITSYQLVTGRHPFQCGFDAGYYDKHARAKRIPPHRVNPAVLETLSDLIIRMIHPNRRDRPKPAAVARSISRILRPPCLSTIADPFAGCGMIVTSTARWRCPESA